jgi:hypothetical protein
LDNPRDLTGQQQFLFTASEDKAVRQYNVDTGGLIRIIVGHTASCTSVQLSADNRFLFSSSLDKSVAMHHIPWSPNTADIAYVETEVRNWYTKRLASTNGYSFSIGAQIHLAQHNGNITVVLLLNETCDDTSPGETGPLGKKLEVLDKIATEFIQAQTNGPVLGQLPSAPWDIAEENRIVYVSHIAVIRKTEDIKKSIAKYTDDGILVRETVRATHCCTKCNADLCKDCYKTHIADTKLKDCILKTVEDANVEAMLADDALMASTNGRRQSQIHMEEGGIARRACTVHPSRLLKKYTEWGRSSQMREKTAVVDKKAEDALLLQFLRTCNAQYEENKTNNFREAEEKKKNSKHPKRLSCYDRKDIAEKHSDWGDRDLIGKKKPWTFLLLGAREMKRFFAAAHGMFSLKDTDARARLAKGGILQIQLTKDDRYVFASTTSGHVIQFDIECSTNVRTFSPLTAATGDRAIADFVLMYVLRILFAFVVLSSTHTHTNFSVFMSVSRPLVPYAVPFVVHSAVPTYVYYVVHSIINL